MQQMKPMVVYGFGYAGAALLVAGAVVTSALVAAPPSAGLEVRVGSASESSPWLLVEAPPVLLGALTLLLVLSSVSFTLAPILFRLGFRGPLRGPLRTGYTALAALFFSTGAFHALLAASLWGPVLPMAEVAAVFASSVAAGTAAVSYLAGQVTRRVVGDSGG